MNQLLERLLHSQGSLFDRLILDLERATGEQALDVEVVGQVITQARLKLQPEVSSAAVDLSDEVVQSLLQRQLKIVHQQAQTMTRTDYLASLPSFRVWELSAVAQDRLRDLSDDDKITTIADLPRGYFELNPLRPLTLVSEASVQQLSADFGFLPRESTSNFQLSLVDLIKITDALDRTVCFSNLLSLCILSQQRASRMAKVLRGELTEYWTLAGNPVPTQSIYRLMGQKNSLLHQKICTHFPEVGQAMIDFDAYSWLTQQVLANDFWSQTAALDINSKIISFNLCDQVLNQVNYPHLEEAVWTKLVSRYLENDNLTEQIVNQLAKRLG